MCDENATSQVYREAMMKMLGIRKTKGMGARGTCPIQPRDQVWEFFSAYNLFRLCMLAYACLILAQRRGRALITSMNLPAVCEVPNS